MPFFLNKINGRYIHLGLNHGLQLLNDISKFDKKTGKLAITLKDGSKLDKINSENWNEIKAALQREGIVEEK
jgi:hypothetical protein